MTLNDLIESIESTGEMALQLQQDFANAVDSEHIDDALTEVQEKMRELLLLFKS